jgi:probable rRNA maturation factor
MAFPPDGPKLWQGMAVDTVIEEPRWQALGLEALAERAAAAVFARLKLDAQAFEIVVLGADDVRIAALNADFRGKPRPTNVLSWPSEERGAETEGGPPLPPEDPELGDIALAYQTCAREAEAAGKPLHDHACHLIVHGILHLLGYDHVRDGDAALMEGLEIEILATMGIADPYS